MINLVGIMKELSARRPIFHSEADFQHAFAWAIHKTAPDTDVRLELPLETHGRQVHVDIWLSRPGASMAIELKYKTRGLATRIGQESFHLKDQAAQDLARYDLMKDVLRLEQLSAAFPSTTGLAVFLSNDSAYWKRPTSPASVDAQFRIHEGRELAGTLQWGAGASPGTARGREEPIRLAGNYRLNWNDYSRVASGSYDLFRYFAIPVLLS